DRHGLLIVATTFPNEDWPGSRPYNDGNVREEDGTVRPREAWSHAIPFRVFALLREAGVTTRERAYLWGHSAGGQFVHRALATQDSAQFEAAGAGNAGWYTLPTLDLPYPDGLGGIGLSRDDVVRFLGYPLVIFSGDQDIDGTTENFPKHESAMAQGPNRFARAQFFVDYGRAAAAKLGVPCRWTRVVVPGVAHEGMKMSAFAAQYWFDRAGI
ncbi:MAG TPA: alpha/beta hydrolase, partial [Stellaceae bacterium]